MWCLLVLAAVAAQALVPTSAPEARTTGSPFNPATIDVSTGHARRDELPRAVARDDGDDDAAGQVPGTAALLPVGGEEARLSVATAGIAALPTASIASGRAGLRWKAGRPRAPPCT